MVTTIELALSKKQLKEGITLQQEVIVNGITNQVQIIIPPNSNDDFIVSTYVNGEKIRFLISEMEMVEIQKTEYTQLLNYKQELDELKKQIQTNYISKLSQEFLIILEKASLYSKLKSHENLVEKVSNITEQLTQIQRNLPIYFTKCIFSNSNKHIMLRHLRFRDKSNYCLSNIKYTMSSNSRSNEFPLSQGTELFEQFKNHPNPNYMYVKTNNSQSEFIICEFCDPVQIGEIYFSTQYNNHDGLQDKHIIKQAEGLNIELISQFGNSIKYQIEYPSTSYIINVIANQMTCQYGQKL